MSFRKPVVHQKKLDERLFNIPYGLSFHPTLEPEYSDAQTDLPDFLEMRGGENDNSEAVLDIVSQVVLELADIGAILEIGIAAYGPEHSMTTRVLAAKEPWVPYLGIDLADRSQIDDEYARTYTLRLNSNKHAIINACLYGLTDFERPISLLIIDGDHSVKGALNDWKYAELLAPSGVCLIHDTNSHPGPIALVAAIDRKKFDVVEPLASAVDFGIAIVRRKP